MPSDSAMGVGVNYGPSGPAKPAASTVGSSPMQSAPGTYYAPAPGSVQAAEDYTTAQNAYNNALARYNQQRQGLLTQYGYKGTVDPTTGMMTNVGVDTSNAQGQLQQLLHTQDSEDVAAQNANEDRGIFGGLANQDQSELAYEHQGQTGNLATTLEGNLDDLNSQQQDSKSTLDQALWQLQNQAVGTAVDSNQFNPADLSSLLASLGLNPDGSPKSTLPNLPASKGAPTAALKPKAPALNLSAPAAALKSKVAATVVKNAYTTSKTKKG